MSQRACSIGQRTTRDTSINTIVIHLTPCVTSGPRILSDDERSLARQNSSPATATATAIVQAFGPPALPYLNDQIYSKSLLAVYILFQPPHSIIISLVLISQFSLVRFQSHKTAPFSSGTLLPFLHILSTVSYNPKVIPNYMENALIPGEPRGIAQPF